MKLCDGVASTGVHFDRRVLLYTRVKNGYVRLVEPNISKSPGATLAERLACSPPTKANRVQSPAGPLPDFRKWESYRAMPLVGGFSPGISRFPAISFRRCSILILITPIGSTGLAVKSRPNLLTHTSAKPEVNGESPRACCRKRKDAGEEYLLGAPLARAGTSLVRLTDMPPSEGGGAEEGSWVRAYYDQHPIAAATNAMLNIGGSGSTTEDQPQSMGSLECYRFPGLVLGDKDRLEFWPQVRGNTEAAAKGQTSEVLVYTGLWSLAYRGLTVAERLACSPPANPRPGHSRILACGNRAGRCRWSASAAVLTRTTTCRAVCCKLPWRGIQPGTCPRAQTTACRTSSCSQFLTAVLNEYFYAWLLWLEVQTTLLYQGIGRDGLFLCHIAGRRYSREIIYTIRPICSLVCFVRYFVCWGAAVAERLARSPATKAIRAQSPAVVTGPSQVGIVPDDVTGRWALPGISRLPRTFIPARK
ncbi:hypothetical protein PR048_026197 [Dryococelus australis]|uniref:Uncharacterized protein n=1 Tax=Dryococelus australis TaxID=614101 RepID=A0ABQ9GKP1_9NEOP|nr:hypothetical protein PR048_026197 [Dryococelus australis]